MSEQDGRCLPILTANPSPVSHGTNPLMNQDSKPLVTAEDFKIAYKSSFYAKKYADKYRHWFPLYPSARLAGIVADLTGDGHLQGKPKWRLDYTSKSKKELTRFGKEVCILFKVKGKIRECTTNKLGKSFNYGVNCKPLARVLLFCGVPAGNKVNNNFLIPKWIAGDKDYFQRYAQRIFTCEGTVDISKSPSISIEMYKSVKLLDSHRAYLEQIRKQLKRYFNIKTTKVFKDKRVMTRKKGIKTQGLKFKIKRKESVINFYKQLGFENADKQERLRNLVLK